MSKQWNFCVLALFLFASTLSYASTQYAKYTIVKDFTDLVDDTVIIFCNTDNHKFIYMNGSDDHHLQAKRFKPDILSGGCGEAQMILKRQGEREFGIENYWPEHHRDEFTVYKGTSAAYAYRYKEGEALEMAEDTFMRFKFVSVGHAWRIEAPYSTCAWAYKKKHVTMLCEPNDKREWYIYKKE